MRGRESRAPTASVSNRRLTRWHRAKGWIDGLWGFDAFIAHRRADGQAYSHRLYDLLQSKGIDCFIDTEVYHAGDGLKVATKRNVSKSTILVLVGSPEVYRAPRFNKSGRVEVDWVEEEIRTYLESNGDDAKVVFVNFGMALENSPSHPIAVLLEDRIWLSRDIEALNEAPDDEVVVQITSQLEGRRRDRSRIRVFKGVIAGLAMLLIGLGFLTVLAQTNADVASQRAVEADDRRIEGGIQRRRAEQNGLLAAANEKEAIEKTELAERNLSFALINLKEAARQGMDVKRNRRDAQKNAAEALFQQGIAQKNLTLALINEEIAKRNEAIAKQNEATAISRELAALAVSEASERPSLALVLAVESWFSAPLELPASSISATDTSAVATVSRTPEARAALAIATSSMAAARVRAGPDLRAVQLDPDGAAVLTRDGKSLVYSSSDGAIRMLDLASGRSAQLVSRAAPTSRVRDLALSPDGTTLAVAAGDVTLWRLDEQPATPRVIAQGDGPLEFTPDGGQLLALTAGGNVLAWDLSGSIDQQGEPRSFGDGWTDFDVNRRGSRLALTGSGGGKVQILDLESGLVISAGGCDLCPDLSRLPNAKVVFDPSGSGDSFAVSSLGTIQRFKPDGEREGDPLVISPDGRVETDIAFQSNGRTLIGLVRSIGVSRPPNRALVWDLTEPEAKPSEIEVQVRGLLTHPTEPTLFAIGATDAIRTFELGPLMPTILGIAPLTLGHQAQSVPSPGVGSELLATTDPEARVIHLLNMATGARDRIATSFKVVDIDVAPDDSAVAAVGEAGQVALWRRPFGDSAPAFFDLTGKLAFSDDGAELFVIGPETITTINTVSGRADSRPFDPVGHFVDSARGLALYRTSDDFFTVELKSSRLVASGPLPLAISDDFPDVLFSATGDEVLVGSIRAGEVVFFGARSGLESRPRLDLNLIVPETQPLNPRSIRLAVSPDGGYLFAGSGNERTIWDLRESRKIVSVLDPAEVALFVSDDGRFQIVVDPAGDTLTLSPGIHPATACKLGLSAGEDQFRELRGRPSICSKFFD